MNPSIHHEKRVTPADRDIHTCSERCPCQTGGEPLPDFTPAELRPAIDGNTPSAAWPERPQWGYAQRYYEAAIRLQNRVLEQGREIERLRDELAVAIRKGA